MSFPKIGQFRHVIQTIRAQAQYVGQDDNDQPIFDASRPLPVLSARGTVKIHGTNAGVTLKDGTLVCFSRREVITPENDNAGFARFVAAHEDAFKRLFEPFDEPVTLRGEWCGKGVQKGCAIHELEKMFIIFAVARLDGSDSREWLDVGELFSLEDPEARIFHVERFGTYTIDIDFNKPEIAQQTLETLTLAVENECPVGKFFGAKGIGEGIVWVIQDPTHAGSEFWFKVKGDKHKVSRTRRLVEINPEVAASIAEFVDMTVTDARLNQGVELLEANATPITQAATGTFLRWVFNDIMKEESDRLDVSGLKKKDVSSAISQRARSFWFAVVKG